MARVRWGPRRAKDVELQSLLRNLAYNPRGAAGNPTGYGTGQTITPAVPVVGAPDGATTALRVAYASGASNPGTVFAGAGTLFNRRYLTRVDVLVESGHTSGFGLAQSGVTAQVPPVLSVGVWTRVSWYGPALPSNDQPLGFRLSTTITQTGSFLVTNMLCLELPEYGGPMVDGASPSWSWAGTPQSSTSTGRVFSL